MTRQIRYRRGREWSLTETLGHLLASATRYDLALWAIPTAFVLALVAGSMLAIPQHAAFVGAALIGVIVLVDAIALNPPVEPPTAQE